SSTPPPPLPPHDELLARINRIRIKVRELDVLSDVIRTVGSVHSGGVERGERMECLQGSTQDEPGAEMEGKTQEILLLGLGHLDLEVGMWQLALALELMEGHYTGEVAAKRRKPQRVIKTYDPVWSAEEIGFLN